MKTPEEVIGEAIDIMGKTVAPLMWSDKRRPPEVVEHDRSVVRRHMREGFAALSAAGYEIREKAPEGYVTVPREPTEAICQVAIAVMQIIVQQYGSCRTADFPLVWRAIVNVVEYVRQSKEPRHGCYDCGRKYGDEFGFPDLVIDNDAWKQISPTGNEGGLLCPSCICQRLHKLELQTTGVFRSGPLAAPTKESRHPEG